MAKQKNGATETTENPGIDLTELEGGELVQDQTGFPPYWNPAPGKMFAGIVMARDERDPDFVRYVIQAACTHQCQEGPADEAMPVTVSKGGFLNVSEYASLPLSDYFGQFVKVTALRKRSIDGGKHVWIFKLETTKAGKALAEQHRAARLAAAQKELPAELQG